MNNGKIFYVAKIGETKIEEIRRKVKIGGQTRYIIDRKVNPMNVSHAEFLTIPAGFRIIKVE
jgi:hypothetical protein